MFCIQKNKILAHAPMATDKESATNAQAANPSRLQTNQSYTLQPIKLSQ